MTEIYYLSSIYELLQKLVPFTDFITGVIQFFIVVFVVYILYKLFNLFF